MATAKVPTSRPPQRAYFGPKDPQTGEMLPEEPYVHVEYPRSMFHKDFGDVVINSDEELEALGPGWSKTHFGPPHAPSQEEIQAMRRAEITAKLKGKEATPEEKISAAKDAVKTRLEKVRAKE